jgi:hypothetical protein
MKTNREKAAMLLNKLTNEGDGVTHQALLEYLISDYMGGAEAYQALLAAENEFFSWDDDMDNDELDSRFDEED